MVWKYEKFKGDVAIYAFCPKYGFYHNPSRITKNKTFETDVSYQYVYCPMCGEYLFDDSDNVEVIWNKRDITELYKVETNNG